MALTRDSNRSEEDLDQESDQAKMVVSSMIDALEHLGIEVNFIHYTTPSGARGGSTWCNRVVECAKNGCAGCNEILAALRNRVNTKFDWETTH